MRGSLLRLGEGGADDFSACDESLAMAEVSLRTMTSASLGLLVETSLLDFEAGAEGEICEDSRDLRSALPLRVRGFCHPPDDAALSWFGEAASLRSLEMVGGLDPFLNSDELNWSVGD
jgi:hypothetical protein